MSKIKVHWIHGGIGTMGRKNVWGGVLATNFIIERAFKASERIELVGRDFRTLGRRSWPSCRSRPRRRSWPNGLNEVGDFLAAGDMSWVDVTSLLQQMYHFGMDRPDIIGPITRSPVKRYNKGEWESGYTPDWFYGSGKLLRLNEAEEKPKTILPEYEGTDWLQHVNFIRHGVPVGILKPKPVAERNLILWAGNPGRPAKNYAMWKEIVAAIEAEPLPEPFEVKTLVNYGISEYWDLLDRTAIVVNTSKYESFCCAVNEARAKGAAILVRTNFNGQLMFLDQPGQIEYDAENYVAHIRLLCENPKAMAAAGVRSRNWVFTNCHPRNMRQDIEKVILGEEAEPYFIKPYFDDKPLPELLKTITPRWTTANLMKDLKLLDVPAEAERVLEIGCGIGRLLKPISEMPNVRMCYGTDASASMIDEAHKYCKGVRALFSLCSGDGTFTSPGPVDFAFAWLTFQHIPSTRAVERYLIGMAEAVRSGGVVKCQLLRHNEKPDQPLWTWHNHEDLATVLDNNGCKTTVEHITDRWTMITGVKEQ